jgi:single-strand DNA-binding protein
MNKIILIGRLTKDVEIRITQTGKKVASFSLAIDDGKNPNGEKQTLFVNCSTWEKKAEVLQNYTSKGDKICIVGKLQTRSYEKEGVKKYLTEILVNELELLESKKDKEERRSGIVEQLNEGVALPNVEEIDVNLPF